MYSGLVSLQSRTLFLAALGMLGQVDCCSVHCLVVIRDSELAGSVFCVKNCATAVGTRCTGLTALFSLTDDLCGRRGCWKPHDVAFVNIFEKL